MFTNPGFTSVWFHILLTYIRSINKSETSNMSVSTSDSFCLITPHMYIQPLTWEWIDQKLDVKWKYLLSFTFAHTAFLLCRAELWELFIRYIKKDKTSFVLRSSRMSRKFKLVTTCYWFQKFISIKLCKC